MRKEWVLAIAVVGGGTAAAQVAEVEEPVRLPFSGAYLGLTVGSQNVWGGSSVEGVDMLAEDRRIVTELVLGARKQFARRWVLGAEIQYGWLDGDLALDDPARPLSIRYENDDQLGYGAIAGFVVGSSRPSLIHLYGFETEREFAVTIDDGNGSFRQTDEQGFLRYGVGVETRWTSRLRSRAMVGSYLVDFGGQVTNIDVSGELELTIGLVISLNPKPAPAPTAKEPTAGGSTAGS